jgi:hypothetical protein
MDKNNQLLERLDNILDDVDRILLSMELDREVKAKLTAFSYTLFMEAEAAVINAEEKKIA